MNLADLGHVNIAGTVHFHVGVEIDLAPDPYPHFIAGADHIVGRYRNLVNRGKGGGNATKQVVAKDGQDLTGSRSDHFLKVGERLRGRRRYGRIALVPEGSSVVYIGGPIPRIVVRHGPARLLAGARLGLLASRVSRLLRGLPISRLLGVLPVSGLAAYVGCIQGIGTVHPLLRIAVLASGKGLRLRQT